MADELKRAKADASHKARAVSKAEAEIAELEASLGNFVNVEETVRLNDSAVCELVGSELGQSGVKVELVKRLPALHEFKGIAERDFFSHHIGYSGGEN